MFDLRQTETFRRWRGKLKDERVRGLLSSPLDRLAFGHFGDASPIGEGVSELRIHHGPGYRIYFQQRGSSIIVLLCAGDKGSQGQDVKLAKRLAREWGG